MSINNITEIEITLWKKLFTYLEQEYLLTEEILRDQNFLEKKLYELIESEEIVLPSQMTAKLVSRVINRINGLGPLQDLINDSSVSEIMVNGLKSIFIERNGVLERTSLSFNSEEELLNIINRIVGPIGRRIDQSSPMVDARLPDGSRVNAIIPPLSLTGPILTIRKFSQKTFTLERLVKLGSLDENLKRVLEKSIGNKDNIIISGGTGTGKTSLLNALSREIDSSERIITIEDSAELQLDHPHLVSLESRPANAEGAGIIEIRDLVKNALRMRPDRIIVGEIRGAEAIDMLQAMNTGHQGSITTVHANAPLEALLRLETMVLMGNVDLPLLAVRQQIISAISLIIQLERDGNGKRFISQVSRLTDKTTSREEGKYKLKNIYS